MIQKTLYILFFFLIGSCSSEKQKPNKELMKSFISLADSTLCIESNLAKDYFKKDIYTFLNDININEYKDLKTVVKKHNQYSSSFTLVGSLNDALIDVIGIEYNLYKNSIPGRQKSFDLILNKWNKKKQEPKYKFLFF